MKHILSFLYLLAFAALVVLAGVLPRSAGSFQSGVADTVKVEQPLSFGGNPKR